MKLLKTVKLACVIAAASSFAMLGSPALAQSRAEEGADDKEIEEIFTVGQRPWRARIILAACGTACPFEDLPVILICRARSWSMALTLVVVSAVRGTWPVLRQSRFSWC